MKRPLGVTILAILCFVSACVTVLSTARIAPDQWQRYRNPLPVSLDDDPLWHAAIVHPITILIVFLALVVFFLRLGWGLWKLEDSARIGLAIYLGLNLMMLAGVEWLTYASESGMEGWPAKILAVAVTVLITTYLFLPATKRAFLH
jgi:hypothetical protein